jgi:hypothetical protein
VRGYNLITVSGANGSPPDHHLITAAVRVEHGGPKGARLVATRAFSAGETIGRFEEYWVTRKPTYLSIQVGPGRHIENLGQFSYLNHSCDPSTIVDTEAMALLAARDIAPGDELTFFYPATEWEMERPFACLCGAPACLKQIQGARHLSPDVLARYRLSRHIDELMRTA